jgi:hypothetical protein
MVKLKKLLNRFNKKCLKALILLISVALLAYGIYPSHAQVTHLKVEASTTLLKAGFINNITLTIFNDFENVYELYASLSFPSSIQTPNAPTVLGASYWKFEKIARNSKVEIPVAIFVPDNAAGNAYTANLALTYKRLGYISTYTEIHSLGFYAKGWIDIILYDLTVDPNPAYPGHTISFTANILNKGNVPAMFTNVSILKNDLLLFNSESSSYLGQLDPNSPAPFTLEAVVNRTVKEGNYTAIIIVSYEDNEHELHMVYYKTQFEIIKLTGETQAKPKSVISYVADYLFSKWFLIVLVAGLILSIGYAVFKFKRKPSEGT